MWTQADIHRHTLWLFLHDWRYILQATARPEGRWCLWGGTLKCSKVWMCVIVLGALLLVIMFGTPWYLNDKISNIMQWSNKRYLNDLTLQCAVFSKLSDGAGTNVSWTMFCFFCLNWIRGALRVSETTVLISHTMSRTKKKNLINIKFFQSCQDCRRLIFKMTHIKGFQVWMQM